MTPQEPSSSPNGQPPGGDPWRAFSYLVTGVALYGLLGWFADRWLGTSFLVVIGIVTGAGLGLYMTFQRFGVPSGPRSKDLEETE